jgi:hypothetical protein
VRHAIVDTFWISVLTLLAVGSVRSGNALLALAAGAAIGVTLAEIVVSLGLRKLRQEGRIQ